MQLMSKYYYSAATNVHHEYPIQQASGFVASFDIKMTEGADELYFFAGGSGPLPCGASCPGGETNKGAFVVGFDVYPGYGGGAAQGQYGPGIYLMDGSGTIVAAGPFSATDTWETVTISYTKGTTNTWVVTRNGQKVLSYSDPNNARWELSSGKHWGIGGRDGGATGDFYISHVSLTLTGADSIPTSEPSAMSTSGPGCGPNYSGPYYYKYLPGYDTSQGVFKYATLAEAERVCSISSSCGGITYEPHDDYKSAPFSMRQSTELGDSPSGEYSCLKKI